MSRASSMTPAQALKPPRAWKARPRSQRSRKIRTDVNLVLLLSVARTDMYRWSRVHLLGRGVEHNMLTATMEAIWHTEASRVGLLTFRGRKKKKKPWCTCGSILCALTSWPFDGRLWQGRNMLQQHVGAHVQGENLDALKATTITGTRTRTLPVIDDWQPCVSASGISADPIAYVEAPLWVLLSEERLSEGQGGLGHRLQLRPNGLSHV